MHKTRKKKIAIAFLSILIVAAFMVNAFALVDETKVIAEVGDKKITMKDLNEAAKAVSNRGLVDLNAKEKINLLKKLVNTEVLYREAMKRNFEKDPEVLAELEKTKKDIMVRVIMKREVTDKISVTDAEVKKFYEENKNNYNYPKEANVTIINVLKTDNQGKVDEQRAMAIAKEIKEGIANGKDINAFLKNYKQPDYSESIVLEEGKHYAEGGKYPVMEEGIFKLKEGETGIIDNYNRYVVVRLDKLIIHEAPPLKDVEVRISGELKDSQWKKLFGDYMESIKKNENVKIYEEELK